MSTRHPATVYAPGAPQAIGPYSHAAVVGRLVLCSGQIGIDPATNALVAGGIDMQTRQALENLASVLTSAGSSLERVARTTVFLTSLAHFSEMNRVYAAAFGDHEPARTTVEVAALPLGAIVEIDCTAQLDG